ncbi:mechanosensitive ion channel family protein [Tistrella mobilis]|uniref:Small-conductance mechanosensitive channel n=1 Tax=Tistrella mobilis (strain KA081020-065) TaxID=1110502 RepID=I3TQV7_TISMK|nr:mechanosensitive ion channel domain-containing protein [Tistrella mobilis]AFK55145.1 MscS mechanosensitive ion channel [Tistrella mobilis KA081020-065]
MDQVTTEIDAVIAALSTLAVTYGMAVLGAIAILIGGWLIAGWLEKGVDRSLGRVSHMDPTLRPFIASLVRYGILVLTVIIVLGQFGVQTASIIAILGAAGLAIGLALQGTLSNVAAGIMLLFLRPFRIGDFIDAGGRAGSVINVNLFTTELKMADGVFMSLPNSQVWGQPITNYARNPIRRMDIVVGIAYDDDIDTAIEALSAVLAADERVLKDPAPQVMVTNLGESSVDITMRFNAAIGDYWSLRWDMMKRAKLAVEAAGCSIPFPQRDVHLIAPKGVTVGLAPENGTERARTAPPQVG